MNPPSTAPLAKAAESSPQSLRKWPRWFAAAVAVWIAIAAIPAIPDFSGTGLDASWILALSLAHHQGLVHGKDIIWTYGPLGYLSLSCFASQPILVFLYHVGLYAVWALALIRLAVSVRNQAPVWSVLVIGIVAILEPTLVNDHLELAIFTWAALALVDDERYRFGETVFLAFLAAIAMLVKVSLGVQAAMMFLCIVASLRRKESKPGLTWVRLAALAATFPVFTIVLYWIFTGTPASFFSYLRYALELSSGYSDSMGMPGPLWQALTAVISLVLLFLVLPLLARPVRQLAPAFAPAAVSAFFLFKNAIVRQDAHVTTFQIKLVLASVFFLITVSLPRFQRALMALQAVFLVMGFFAVSQVWPQLVPFMERRFILQLGEPFHELLHPQERWNTVQRGAAEQLSTVRLGGDFHAIVGKGKVDALPWDLSQVEANHWKWQPRPVFQSYAAYTPVLDRVNAEHFQGSKAADFLLVRWDDIDNRHPFFEAPLSWQAVLDRYESKISDGTTLLLSHTTDHRFPGPESDPAGSLVAHWNQVVAAPQGGTPLVLSAGVRKSLLGSMLSFSYRLSSVWVVVTRQSGRTERYRAVPLNLASGVIINPLPVTLNGFNLIAQHNCISGDPVIALRLEADHPLEFESDIPLHWSYLRTQAGTAKPDPCLVAEASPKEFPSWGGNGTVFILAGVGVAWHVDGAVDWMTTFPVRPGSTDVNFNVAANNGPARTGNITVNGINVPVQQNGSPQEGAPPSVELGLFHLDTYDEAPRSVVPKLTEPGFKILADRWMTFGLPGDQAVMGDWTGTGVVRLGVFRKGWWFLDLNNNRKWDGVEGGDAMYSFGLPGDQAVVGDWNGDGITKLGIFRQGVWVLDINNNHKFDLSDPAYSYGAPGDIALVGKWKAGSRADQLGVYRKGAWVIDSNGDRAFEMSDEQFRFGLEGDIPVVSHSRSHIGVFRNGMWILDTAGIRRFDSSSRWIFYGSKGAQPLIGEW